MKRAKILSLSLMLSMLTGFSASAAKVLDIKSGLTVENSLTTESSMISGDKVIDSQKVQI